MIYLLVKLVKYMSVMGLSYIAFMMLEFLIKEVRPEMSKNEELFVYIATWCLVIFIGFKIVRDKDISVEE